MTIAISRRFIDAPLLALLFVCMTLSGCAQVSAIQAAGAAVGAVLEATGITKKENVDLSKINRDLPIKIFAGDQLNLTSNGKALSLVVKIYILRSPENLKTLTYQQITSTEGEKEALGEELVSVREIVLLPGKMYDGTLKVPGDATTIGVVGMFRAPYQSRWKLGFDSKLSFDGITIGAHACALSASKGSLVSDISPESARSLVGLQCNS